MPDEGARHEGGRRPERVLVKCKPTTDAGRDTCIRQLTAADPCRLNLLVVTYQQSPSDVLEVWRRRVGEQPAAMQIVSAGHPVDPTSTLATDGATPPTPTVVHSDPGDLTQLGITVRERLAEWQGNPNRTAICGGSLTAMLQWVTPAMLVRFLGVFLRQRPGVHVHFHISPDVHEEGLMASLAGLFDEVVEPSSGTGDEGPGELPKELLFELLDDARRRRLLAALLDTPGLVELDELVEQLGTAVPVSEAATEEPPSAARRRLRVSLLHKHLPKLADAGIVAYDEEAETVRLVAQAEQLEPHLDHQE
jgi:DNA-binding transcriptional ArsR family regulator